MPAPYRALHHGHRRRFTERLTARGPAPPHPDRDGRAERRADGRLLRRARAHPGENGTLATADGGEQLRIVAAGRRRLVRLGVGADDPDDPDDPDRAAASLAAIGIPAERTAGSVYLGDARGALGL
jgi:hypothetical protein